MVTSNVLERHEAAVYLCRLADLVEETGLTASDVGRVLTDVFRRSPMEHPAEVRMQVSEMASSRVDAITFAAGLRQRASELRSATGSG